MGLNTLIFTTETFPVPNEWVFEKFLNLKERLSGQSVSIKSIFNKNDTNPSMIIYMHDNGKYKFKDFSSGHQGDAVDLIQLLYNLPSRNAAFQKTYDFYKEGDYDTYTAVDIVKPIFTVDDCKVRPWNKADQTYWTQYKIGSSDLEKYNIKPLEYYRFKMVKGELTTFKDFSYNLCYGFFNKNNILYKIYNPENPRLKFVKVKNYLQGHDQLEYKGQWLIILSSLKDIIAFKKLGFPNIECIAPDSENTIINDQQIKYYKSKYKLITVLFDNDVAGKNSALKYQKKYNIPYTNFEVEKDVADCIKHHGIKNTKIFLQPLLIKTKNEFKTIRKII